METTTETSPDNRELTATEVKITLAQIEDRLARWIDAATSCNDFYMLDEKEPQKVEASARAKNQIPYGVCLFPSDEIVEQRDKSLFMKWAKWWVKGEMNDDSFYDFIHCFSESVEIDYFWVLMDQPAFFYTSRWKDYAGEPTYAELESELKQIGTRSRRSKACRRTLNLPHEYYED